MLHNGRGGFLELKGFLVVLGYNEAGGNEQGGVDNGGVFDFVPRARPK